MCHGDRRKDNKDGKDRKSGVSFLSLLSLRSFAAYPRSGPAFALRSRSTRRFNCRPDSLSLLATG